MNTASRRLRSVVCWFIALSLLLLAAPLSVNAEDTQSVNALLDRMEKAWETHDADAMKRCLSDRGFLAIVSRPDNPEGAWVGDKKAMMTALSKVWSNVVRHEFVERNISVNGNMATMRLAVADKLANGQRRLSRTLNIAAKHEGDWKMCFSMPDMVETVGIVDEVRPDSSAARAGIRNGDVILRCNGQSPCNRHAEDESAGPRTLTIRRGEQPQKIKTDGGPLGVKLTLRWLPADGAALVPANRPHLIKERWLEAFRGFITGDLDRIEAIDSPAGLLVFSPASNGGWSVLGGTAVYDATQRELKSLRKEHDLSSAEMKDIALLHRDDVAVATGRMILPARGNVGRNASLVRSAVFVKQGKNWYRAATLPGEAEVGLPASGTVDPTEVRSRVTGRMVGIGIGLELADGGARINRILPNSPAQAAGVETGTVITAIDNRAVAGLSLKEIVQRLRGPEGAKVTLTLKLPDGSTRETELVRASVVLASVETRDLGEGLFAIRVSAFRDHTAKDVRTELEKYRSQGARGLVLDLRGPCGGTPGAAQAVASLFLPSGKPLWGMQYDGQKAKQVMASGRSFPKFPCVVLIDEKTQGAGVLVAYAIQENRRAKLLGRKTTELNRMKMLVTDAQGKGRLIEHGYFLSTEGNSLVGYCLMPDITISADATEDVWLEKATAILKKSLASSGVRKKAGNPMRVWTDATGNYKIRAEFLGLNNGIVRLKKQDGKIIEIPIQKLCEADQQYAKQASRKQHRKNHSEPASKTKDCQSNRVNDHDRQS